MLKKVMSESQRIDKWLYFMRFAKTRTTAQELIEGGHVAVNGEKVLKCSRDIKIGDELEILRGTMRFFVRVTGFVEKRVGAPIAQTLYEQTKEPENLAPPPKRAFEYRAAGSGRPTKRDRRALNRLKGKF